MLSDSLMNNNGILRTSNVIKFIPDSPSSSSRLATPFGSPRTSSTASQRRSSTR
jgi:hypothetical protein